MADDSRESAYGAFSTKFLEARLEDICVPRTGIQTGPFGSQLHQEDYVAVGTPIITVEHLGENRIVHNNVPRVSDTDRDRLVKYSLRSGDIVFSRVGSVDRRSLVRQDEDGWLFSGRCLRVRPNSEKIDSRYLSYFFGLPAFKEHIRSIAVGATMPSLNTAILSNVTILYPYEIEEQRAIAHILGTLDDKIELNRRMNETLEAMARALFKSWFVDFEPVRAKVEGRDTGLPQEIADLFPDSFENLVQGEVPNGWKLQPLYDTATYVNGAAFKNDDFCESNEGLPVIKIAELKDGISSQTKYSCRNANDAQRINTGDLLYSWSGSPDTSLDAFLWTNGSGLLNQHIFKVVVSSTAQKRFVYYLLKFLRPVLVETARNKQTTGLGHVTIADMKRIQVCSPPLSVLFAFDKLIAPLFDRAFCNTLESRTLAAQRDALLPKLLSGEVRVKDIEQTNL